MALALYTFGMLTALAEDPANDGFWELNHPIFKLVDQAEGLIARSGYASDRTQAFEVFRCIPGTIVKRVMVGPRRRFPFGPTWSRCFRSSTLAYTLQYSNAVGNGPKGHKGRLW